MTPEAPELAEQTAKRISVVIVSYNRINQLRETLAALGDAHQVVVVDNGSSDGSYTLDVEFPYTRLIRLPKNFGLTKALNIGIRAAEGTYVMLLHDDAIVSGDSVTKLADYLEGHSEAGAVAPLLVHGGNAAPQVRPLPNPSDPDPVLAPAGEDARIVESASGAAIMFRAFFLRALRQIDEHYGTYGGIVDLCWQVKRAGRRVVLLHEVTADHASLPSPMSRSALEGDRVNGTAVYLGKYHGFMPGMLYRLKSGFAGLLTFRFKVVAAAFSGAKIDGTT